MILVAGTGRSGTLTITRHLADAGLTVAHEPDSPFTMIPSVMWPQGMDDLTALAWLSHVQWARDGNVFWRYTTMLPLLETLFPGAQWIWAHRNARDTVASMVAHGWYAPEDDEAWPALLVWPDGREAKIGKTGRCRPTGYTLGDMTFNEWRALPQTGRCCWWWGKTFEIMSGWRCVRYAVESGRPDLLCEVLGLPAPRRVHVANHTERRPDPPADLDRWLRRFCSEGMDGLYG